MNTPNRKPAGWNSRIRAARRPRIAESPATRPLSFTVQVLAYLHFDYEVPKLLLVGSQSGTTTSNRVRKISPKFSCIRFFQMRDVPTQIPGHPGNSLSKTTEKGHLHKVFVRDIPTSGSRMSQEYPAQKLCV